MGGVGVLDEDEALELLAFLITAARTQVDEAKEYGPLRLLTAARRLADAIAPRSSPQTSAFLAESLPRMPLLAVPREDPGGYVRQLDDLCAALGRHLTSRYASGAQAT
jgi:Family of unknown function (DUF6092)